MEKSITDLAENKVLILYLLNKLSDGIKSDNLYKLVSSANNINYFYFQELLTDLIDTNLVGSFTKEEDTFIKDAISSIVNCFDIFLSIYSEISHTDLFNFINEPSIENIATTDFPSL